MPYCLLPFSQHYRSYSILASSKRFLLAIGAIKYTVYLGWKIRIASLTSSGGSVGHGRFLNHLDKIMYPEEAKNNP